MADIIAGKKRCRALFLAACYLMMCAAAASAEGIAPSKIFSLTCKRYLEGYQISRHEPAKTESESLLLVDYKYAFGYAVGYFQSRRDMTSGLDKDLTEGDQLSIRRFLLKRCAEMQEAPLVDAIRGTRQLLDR